MLLWEPTPDLHHQTAIHRIIQSIRPTSAHGAEVECCVDRLILTKDGSILRPDIALFTTQQCHHPDPLRTLPFAVIEILSPETERNILEIAAPAYQKLGITETLAVSLRTDTLHLWTPGTTGTFQTPITIQLSNGIQITITT
jgi:Uma2 family endonuclease